MPAEIKPKKYIVQKHVMATSVEEAIRKESSTPITSVFPDDKQTEEKNSADAVGFKYVDVFFPYEY